MHDVRIELLGPGHGKVFLDGHEVSCVRDLQLSAAAGPNPNELKLNLFVRKVEVNARDVRLVGVTPEVIAKRCKSAPSYFEHVASRPLDRCRA